MSGYLVQGGVTPDDSVSTAKIQDDAVTLAKLAAGTDGNLISYDASGNPVAIATGSDGEVLTSTGAGSPPAFEAAAAGGFTLGTVFNASSGGTSNTWTGIPSGTTNIIISMYGIDDTASTQMTIRLGDAGGLESSGYFSKLTKIAATSLTGSHETNGFEMWNFDAGHYGAMHLTLVDSSTNTWAMMGAFNIATNAASLDAGGKVLSGELTQIQIIIPSGAFGPTVASINGIVNIQYI